MFRRYENQRIEFEYKLYPAQIYDPAMNSMYDENGNLILTSIEDKIIVNGIYQRCWKKTAKLLVLVFKDVIFNVNGKQCYRFKHHMHIRHSKMQSLRKINKRISVEFPIEKMGICKLTKDIKLAQVRSNLEVKLLGIAMK